MYCDGAKSVLPVLGSSLRLSGPGYRAALHKVPVGAPLDCMAIDILGELPETGNGNKSVLVITDYFTKWTQAFDLPDQTALSVGSSAMPHLTVVMTLHCSLQITYHRWSKLMQISQKV